jgi:hypothetical protein
MPSNDAFLILSLSVTICAVVFLAWDTYRCRARVRKIRRITARLLES